MSSGGGLFGSRRSSAISGLSTQAAQQQPQPQSSSNDTQEPRRRHGSAPLAMAFGLRRGSTPAATASTSSTRRSLTVDTPLPRKMSEPGTVHRPMASPAPKRKPLPKGSAFEKQAVQEDDVNGKLGKMDLSAGSTMVNITTESWLMIDRGEMYLLRLESTVSNFSLLLSMHSMYLCKRPQTESTSSRLRTHPNDPRITPNSHSKRTNREPSGLRSIRRSFDQDLFNIRIFEREFSER